MKSLFHPPSVLFGCDHYSVTHNQQINDEKVKASEQKAFNIPTTKLFTPLTPPEAQQPHMQKLKSGLMV